MSIKRGEIWLANLDPTIGGEIQKTRPVVIVSNNSNNNSNSVVTVVPITSNATRVFSFEVFLSKGTAGLPKDSKARTDQIRTLDKSRLVKLYGQLSASLMNDLDKALKLHLDLF
ncbi:MAG: type II toxin-antitoxin system PemK/MazF family toxin [Rudanella sp.]|nr:type II toxin-antitoxin system PemK/MazF family toxin [Rudanella sp.]